MNRRCFTAAALALCILLPASVFAWDSTGFAGEEAPWDSSDGYEALEPWEPNFPEAEPFLEGEAFPESILEEEPDFVGDLGPAEETDAFSSEESAGEELTASSGPEEGTTRSGLKWTLDQEGTLRISGKGEIKDYEFMHEDEIVRLIFEPGVERIANYAFDDCDSLLSIVFPETLKEISSYSFSNCSSLEEITFAKGLEVIDAFTFNECPALTSIVLPEGLVTVDSFAFRDCPGIRSFSLPDSVTDVGVLSNLENLETIVISEENPNFQLIDGILFDKGLETLLCYPRGFAAEEYIVPEGVKSIGSRVFYQNEHLSRVVFPDSLESIGNSAFSECSALREISFGEGVRTVGNYAFAESALQTLAFPERPVVIESRAFWNCQELQSVCLPGGSIHEEAFLRCPSLTSVTIPDSLEDIECLREMTGLQEVILSESHPVYHLAGGAVFKGNAFYLYPAAREDEEYVVPSEAVQVADYAFRNAEHLKRVIFPEGVESLGSLLFYGCEELEEVWIPDSVKEIHDYAFAEYEDEEDEEHRLILHASSSSYAHAYALEHRLPFLSTTSEITGIELVWTKGKPPVVSLQHLYEGSLPWYLTCLAVYDDGSKSVLPEKDVTLSADMSLWKTGGEENTVRASYQGMEASINFPVSRFGDEYLERPELLIGEVVVIFYYTDGDEEDEYPGVGRFTAPESGLYRFSYDGEWDDDEYVQLYDYDGRSVKIKKRSGWCTASLQKGETYLLFLVDDEDGGWDVTVGFIGEKAPKKGEVLEGPDGYAYQVTKAYEEVALYRAPGGNKKVTVPDTVLLNQMLYRVTSISSGAFRGHTKLKTLVLGDPIRAIGSEAFYGCKKLKTVKLGRRLTTIEDGAFCGCGKLASITLPASVKSIGAQAFYECGSLPSITLPASVESIGTEAFYGCGKLKKLTIQTKKLTYDTVGERAFLNIYRKAKVKVPKKKLSYYKALLSTCGLPAKAKVN